MEMINEAIIFLLAAVIVVPIFKNLGFGAVLGYLTAGILIGPYGLNLITDIEHILHFAELGVVLLLFIIGLELQPSRLWALRNSIFVWGGLQVIASTIIFSLIGMALGYSFTISTLLGFTLSLSSTAFALQMLAERKELTKRHGRSAFTILLFQDIAVVPALAVLPLLSTTSVASADGNKLTNVLFGIFIVLFILFAGRIIMRYFLAIIARTDVKEILTASALLIVMGVAIIIEHIGLSMALGAFLAGVLLADSEYRHQLETDIEPFKGLLLGLFFIAVGMSVNLALLGSEPITIILLALSIVLVKGSVLFCIAKLQGMNNISARQLAFSISQGGEFAFVIFAATLTLGILSNDITETLIVAVTMTMILTPLILMANDFLSAKNTEKQQEYDTPEDENNQVIIAGFGRFGQITGRLLTAKKIRFTALEKDPEQVNFVRKFGNKIFYGDASRLDLLHAANADKAKLFVLAIDDIDESLKTASIVREHFPHLKIFARARNRQHFYKLMDLGITNIRRETFFSALELTRLVLTGLGLPNKEVKQSINHFRDHDIKRLYDHWQYNTDEELMISMSKGAAKELEELFESDKQDEEKNK
jgi:monovalent cation:proton antiporter-2 (CPA2) family protein